MGDQKQSSEEAERRTTRSVSLKGASESKNLLSCACRATSSWKRTPAAKHSVWNSSGFEICHRIRSIRKCIRQDRTADGSDLEAEIVVRGALLVGQRAAVAVKLPQKVQVRV